MPRLFNEQELLERIDHDNDFLSEMVQMLAADGRRLMTEVRAGASAGDANKVARAAHTLKGMVANFCAPTVHTSAAAVEQIGKSGDLSTAPPAIDSLGRDLEALIADLMDFMATRV